MIVPTNALRQDMIRRFSANTGVVAVKNKAEASALVAKLLNENDMFHQQTRLLIIDVESLHSSDFVDALRHCNNMTHVAIDECLLTLQWAQFRPVMLRSLAIVNENSRILMLSATMPFIARSRIACLIETKTANVISTTGSSPAFVNRMNRVKLMAQKVTSKKLIEKVIEFIGLRSLKRASSQTHVVVYLPTVKMTELVHQAVYRANVYLGHCADVLLWHGKLVRDLILFVLK